MIEVNNLGRKYGDEFAIRNLSFQITKGEIFGLIGPNGAGKTTTIRILCCLISPTEGDARIGGLNLNDRINSNKIRKMIGYVPDNVGLYERMSAYENLLFYGKLYDYPKSELPGNIEKYLRIVDLWDERNKPVGSYSKGMKQKVALARALVHEPELLILDEPTANLDPESARNIRDLILNLKKEGRTILFNTHNLDEAQRVCDRIGVLKTTLRAVDTPENLREKYGNEKLILVKLESVTDKIVETLNRSGYAVLNHDAGSLTIESSHLEDASQNIIELVMKEGGKIRSINEQNSSLEDVYIRLVEGEKK
ncbi:MAG: multidrug ABC transporter ATP-binding protein [Cuniculiplasma sp. C_DKE]|nr:MAG: multidrug ABC transporter ATP-binding protein [Cuniculiplasma sp. C_DKE]